MCESIEIRVAKTTMFCVHENVLRQSPFFANALKTEWARARNEISIELEEEDPDTFAAYVQWLYSHQVDPTYDSLKWAKNYVLGEKMMDPNFQDTVIDAFMKACTECGRTPGAYSMVNIIYGGTSVGSPARKLLIDFWTCTVHSDRLVHFDYARNAPVDFVNELLVGFSAARFRKISAVKPWITDRASYMVGSRKKKE